MVTLVPTPSSLSSGGRAVTATTCSHQLWISGRSSSPLKRETCPLGTGLQLLGFSRTVVPIIEAKIPELEKALLTLSSPQPLGVASKSPERSPCSPRRAHQEHLCPLLHLGSWPSSPHLFPSKPPRHRACSNPEPAGSQGTARAWSSRQARPKSRPPGEADSPSSSKLGQPKPNPSLPFPVHVVLYEGPAGPGLVSLHWQLNKESRSFTCTIRSDQLFQLCKVSNHYCCSTLS